MVDGGWGVLQDPSTIWICHHLGFRGRRGLWRSGGCCSLSMLSGSVNNLRMCDSHARRPTTTIWARGETESFGNPSDDLPILCWDLEALPTHHLPWAGFGLRQPHWLIQKCDVKKSRMWYDLEKKSTTTQEYSATRLSSTFYYSNELE